MQIYKRGIVFRYQETVFIGKEMAILSQVKTAVNFKFTAV